MGPSARLILYVFICVVLVSTLVFTCFYVFLTCFIRVIYVFYKCVMVLSSRVCVFMVKTLCNNDMVVSILTSDMQTPHTVVFIVSILQTVLKQIIPCNVSVAMCAYTYAHIYIYIYIYMCVCMYIYICVCIYVHR